MNRRQFTKLLAGVGLLLAGCRAGAAPSSSTPERKDSMQTTTQTYTRTTPIETVRNDPVFGDYGRLIFQWNALITAATRWSSCILPTITTSTRTKQWTSATPCASVQRTGRPSFTIFTPRTNKPLTRTKLTPAYSTSRVIPAQNFPSATQAVRLRMWGPCRTAFLMHWNFPARSTTLLRSSTAPAHRPPAKIWHGPLPLSLPMRRNWK